MILWRNIENYPFYHFDSDPRFPPFLLYVRWKSGVTFVRRCFRDDVLKENLKEIIEKKARMKDISNAVESHFH